MTRRLLPLWERSCNMTTEHPRALQRARRNLTGMSWRGWVWLLGKVFSALIFMCLGMYFFSVGYRLERSRETLILHHVG